MSNDTRILVQQPCAACHGTGSLPAPERPSSTVPCVECIEGRVHTTLSLEEFAKLFTWGKTYELGPERGERNVILPVSR